MTAAAVVLALAGAGVALGFVWPGAARRVARLARNPVTTPWVGDVWQAGAERLRVTAVRRDLVVLSGGHVVVGWDRATFETVAAGWTLVVRA